MCNTITLETKTLRHDIKGRICIIAFFYGASKGIISRTGELVGGGGPLAGVPSLSVHMTELVQGYPTVSFPQ
jgi:hypothetical protein